MLLDPAGTANISRHERADGSQGDGRDGKRGEDLDKGKSGAPVQILLGGRLQGGPALKGRWLEQPQFPLLAKRCGLRSPRRAARGKSCRRRTFQMEGTGLPSRWHVRRIDGRGSHER